MKLDHDGLVRLVSPALQVEIEGRLGRRMAAIRDSISDLRMELYEFEDLVDDLLYGTCPRGPLDES